MLKKNLCLEMWNKQQSPNVNVWHGVDSSIHLDLLPTDHPTSSSALVIVTPEARGLCRFHVKIRFGALAETYDAVFLGGQPGVTTSQVWIVASFIACPFPPLPPSIFCHLSTVKNCAKIVKNNDLKDQKVSVTCHLCTLHFRLHGPLAIAMSLSLC